MTVTLAADLGSTRVKVGLVSAPGEVLDHVSLPAPQITATEECADIDPEHWWTAFCEGTAALLGRDGNGAPTISAIAITGQTRTQIVVDANARPLMPAMAWSDRRGHSRADALRGGPAGSHPEAAQLNAFHPLARLAWIAAERPDVMARAVACIEPKDYIVARLTGAIGSDPVSQARLVAAAASGPTGASLFEAAGVPARLLPPLRRPHEVAGLVRDGHDGGMARLAGVPVLTGCNDTWTAVLGLGALRPRYAYAISGTTEVFGLVTDRSCRAEGLLTVDWGAGLTQIGGPGQNGADTLAWLMELISASPSEGAAADARLTALLAAPRHSRPLLFLPYLRGERVPFWDADLRGAVLGLSREHTATDIAWAILEGLALLNRTVLARAEAAAGHRAGEIRMGGGLSRLPQAAQIKADVLERHVVVGASEEPGLVGAGLLAAVGVHGATSLEAAQESVAVGHRYVPASSRQAFYNALFAVFTEAHAAVAPLSHRLARFERMP